jgi:hypothetical protein
MALTPEQKALKLLRKQPADVREAVAVLLESVTEETLRYFKAIQILGWLADEIRGRPFRGVPTEAIEEHKIP